MPSVIAYLGLKEAESPDARLAILEYANRTGLTQIEFWKEESLPRRQGHSSLIKRIPAVLEPGSVVLIQSPVSFRNYLGYAEFLSVALAQGACVHVINVDGQVRIYDGAPASWAEAWAILCEDARHHAMHSRRAVSARENGKRGGRKRGSVGPWKLVGRDDEIRHFLKLKLSARKAARHLGVTPKTYTSYVQEKGLRAD